MKYSWFTLPLIVLWSGFYFWQFVNPDAWWGFPLFVTLILIFTPLLFKAFYEVLK